MMASAVSRLASPPVQHVCVCDRPLPLRDEDDGEIRCLTCGRRPKDAA